MSAPLTYEQFLDLQQDNEVGDLWHAYSEALAVVAAQREALERLHDWASRCAGFWQAPETELARTLRSLIAEVEHDFAPHDSRGKATKKAISRARAVLDAEGVSEPPVEGSRLEAGGSLTYPVDTAPRRLRKWGPWGWVSEPGP